MLYVAHHLYLLLTKYTEHDFVFNFILSTVEHSQERFIIQFKL